MKFEADANCVDTISPAVNYGERRDVSGPDILLLHYTGMDSEDGALRWLCAEESGVSCHYFVHEDGRIVQLLPERVRAHHAGVGAWEGHHDINSRSIGVEIANAGHAGGLPDFPQIQMDAVARLSLDIVERNGIAARYVLAHSDIAPGRKEDPGEKFDWKWLAGHGVGHWVEPVPVRSGRFLQQGDAGQPVAALQSMLALYGYDIEINEIFDERTATVLTAFQRHFRQKRVDGVADVSTIETLHNLLSALPETIEA